MTSEGRTVAILLLHIEIFWRGTIIIIGRQRKGQARGRYAKPSQSQGKREQGNLRAVENPILRLRRTVPFGGDSGPQLEFSSRCGLQLPIQYENCCRPRLVSHPKLCHPSTDPSAALSSSSAPFRSMVSTPDLLARGLFGPPPSLPGRAKTSLDASTEARHQGSDRRRRPSLQSGTWTVV